MTMEKVDLSKDYWNPKRKMWVTTHFFQRYLSNDYSKKNVKIQKCMAISFQI